MISIKNIFNRAKSRKSDSLLFTLQSEKNSLQVLELTNAYLNSNKEVAEKIGDILCAYRVIIDLLPQTLKNKTSGHTIPIIESEYELECSIQLCKLGYYKHAIIALRNVLELGTLSIYWDRDGNSHINIREWVSSNESTPFQSKVIKTLKKHKRIALFDNKHNILQQTTNLFRELSDFSHTKGLFYSGVDLGNSNINTFNEESVRTWFQYMERMVKIVITLHILQYPIGLQNIDLWSKFGLNPPAGGFLTPSDAVPIRRCLDSDVLETLQAISDTDPDATSIAQQINDMPDLTEEQIRAQEEEMDKRDIKMSGYKGWWLKIQKTIAKNELKRHPGAFIRRIKRLKKLKKWAKENGCYDKRKTVTMSKK